MRHHLRQLLGKSLVRHGASSVIAAYGVAVLGIINMKLLIDLLGMEAFGQLAIIQAFAMLMMNLCHSYSWQPYLAVMERLSNKADQQAVTLLCRRIDILACLICFLLATLVLWVMGLVQAWESDTITLAHLYSLILLTHLSINWPSGLLRWAGHFHLLAWHRVALQSLITISIAILWIAGDASLLDCLLIFMAGRFLEHLTLLAIGIWVARKHGLIGSRSGNSFQATFQRFPEFRTMLGASYGQQLLQALTLHADTLFIGSVLGATEAGQFKLIKNIALLLINFTNPIRDLLFAFLSRIAAQEGKDGIRSETALIAGLLSITTLCIYSLYYVFGDYLLQWFVPDDIATMWIPSLIYMGGAACVLMSSPLQPIYYSLNQSLTYLWMMKGATILMLVGTLTMTPLYGLEGAAAAYLFYGLVALTLPGSWLMRRWNQLECATVDSPSQGEAPATHQSRGNVA